MMRQTETRRWLLGILVLLSFCALAVATVAEEADAPKPIPTPPKPIPTRDFVVFTIKHRSAEEVREYLLPLLREAPFEVDIGPQNTLIVTDLSPDMRPFVETIIRLADVPPVTYEVRARLILAVPEDPPEPIPGELEDVAALLGNVFRFTNYKLVDHVVIRANTERTVRLAAAGGKCSLQLRARYQPPEEGDPKTGVFAFDEFVFVLEGNRILETTFRVLSGDTVIVGASRMEDPDEALIIILTATCAPGLPLPQAPEKAAKAP